MIIKKRMKILSIIISLLVIFSLAGCKPAGTDKTQITQIAKNIEEAIEEKDVDLFMENVSYNYSDTEGGTYDNHINGLPEEIFSEIELVETLLDPILGLKVITDVSITNLIVTEPYATGEMKITISLKWCIIWCSTFPGTDDEKIKYNVDFIKEDDDWKIISLTEI